MSELQNPLFDEEKEFLERKKLEYERALRGDVEHIKEQSVKVGKLALVGAGLAGGVWLIAKAFGGKKKRKHRPEYDQLEAGYDSDGPDYDGDDQFQEESRRDEEAGAEYFTSGNGKRYKSIISGHKSAAESAQAFIAHDEHSHEADDLGFGSTAAQPVAEPFAASAFDNETFEEDPFQDLPYDDSRRLPVSHAFDAASEEPASPPAGSRSRMIGSVLQAFLKTDTGKMLVAQAAAVAMALVTKKVGEFFPPAKNTDLATSPAAAPAAAAGYPVASSVSSVPSDASTPSQSL